MDETRLYNFSKITFTLGFILIILSSISLNNNSEDTGWKDGRIILKSKKVVPINQFKGLNLSLGIYTYRIKKTTEKECNSFIRIPNNTIIKYKTKYNENKKDLIHKFINTSNISKEEYNESNKKCFITDYKKH